MNALHFRFRPVEECAFGLAFTARQGLRFTGRPRADTRQALFTAQPKQAVYSHEGFR